MYDKDPGNGKKSGDELLTLKRSEDEIMILSPEFPPPEPTVTVFFDGPKEKRITFRPDGSVEVVGMQPDEAAMRFYEAYSEFMRKPSGSGVDPKEVVRFIEEEANIADRTGDIAAALVLRRSAVRMRGRFVR